MALNLARNGFSLKKKALVLFFLGAASCGNVFSYPPQSDPCLVREKVMFAYGELMQREKAFGYSAENYAVFYSRMKEIGDSHESSCSKKTGKKDRLMLEKIAEYEDHEPSFDRVRGRVLVDTEKALGILRDPGFLEFAFSRKAEKNRPDDKMTSFFLILGAEAATKEEMLEKIESILIPSEEASVRSHSDEYEAQDTLPEITLAKAAAKENIEGASASSEVLAKAAAKENIEGVLASSEVLAKAAAKENIEGVLAPSEEASSTPLDAGEVKPSIACE
ncbi:MAG: uncharacterized protein A8A55_1041 [Amphiamblys sp. WSBS2006]|nr:MAG: uncharacterized protein A8A55_1041 [Amphiamblys sp. WSBS2006]